MVCLVKVTGFPGSKRPTPVITTSSSLDSPICVSVIGLSAGLWDFSIRTELTGGSAETEVLIGLSSGIASSCKGGSLGISSGANASRSGVLSCSGATSSSAALSRRAFLLGLGLALKENQRVKEKHKPLHSVLEAYVQLSLPKNRF